MDVLELIDELHELAHGAKQVPLRDQVRADKEKTYDILDRMRSTIPEEIRQARWIVKEREEMLAEAKREAEQILEEARERQSQLVSRHELIRQAERAAEESSMTPGSGRSAWAPRTTPPRSSTRSRSTSPS